MLVRRVVAGFSHRNKKHYFFQLKDGLPEEKRALVKPKQYPTTLTDAKPMIPRGRPVRF